MSNGPPENQSTVQVPSFLSSPIVSGQTDSPLRLEEFSGTANSIRQFITTIIIEGILKNIEICLSKMTKNPLKNIHHSWRLL